MLRAKSWAAFINQITMFHNNYSYDLFLHLRISVGCQKESVNYSFELIFDFVYFQDGVHMHILWLWRNQETMQV
jgi:hypothetical protein